MLTNVRELRPGLGRLQSPEIDGLIEIGSRRLLIEVKSFALNQTEIGQILTKYSSIGFDELLIVSPAFKPDRSLPRNVQLIPFHPDLSALRETYSRQTYTLPRGLELELGSGEHHFRYVSAARRRREVATFRNQVDKKIKNVPQVLRDIQRQKRPGDLPVRVFWSVSRWLFPKELFFASYSNHLVRRGLVFDIDGSAIHNNSSACELRPGDSVCLRCLEAARKAAIDLTSFLGAHGFSGGQVVFSGRQGFHIYILEAQLRGHELRQLIQEVQGEGIPVDADFTLNDKAVVTFPGSIHGSTMLRAVPVDDLKMFSMAAVKNWSSIKPVREGKVGF